MPQELIASLYEATITSKYTNYQHLNHILSDKQNEMAAGGCDFCEYELTTINN
jgi:hypothetical protein